MSWLLATTPYPFGLTADPESIGSTFIGVAFLGLVVGVVLVAITVAGRR